MTADLADELIIAHGSLGGRLERLCHDLVAAAKPPWTLDDPANAHLVQVGLRAIQVADAMWLATGRRNVEGP